MICLIPELSFITGLTDDIRSDNRAMKSIATHTRLSPALRLSKLKQFIQRVNSNPRCQQILSSWGMQLGTELYSTNARNISKETLLFGKKKGHEREKFQISGEKWDRALNCLPIYSPVMITSWLLIYVSSDALAANEFVNCMLEVSRKLGLNIAKPVLHSIHNENQTAYVQAIKDNFSGYQIITIMTPGSSQRDDRYSAIKRLCCVDIGIPSQVVRASNLANDKIKSVCQNVALQIICKLGGQLWGVHIPYASAMFIGLDTYHSPIHGHRSVVAVVSSYNTQATSWYSKVYFQNRQEEISNTLRIAVSAALKKYHETNQMMPARIFIYRDGVGDGQISVVKEYEVMQVEKALEDFSQYYLNTKPSFTYIVVQKRINLKFFTTQGRDEQNAQNPLPGTILDQGVTRKQYKDFYLVSQHVAHGTVTPTHYVIVHDTNNMTPDRIQRLTYRITHIYYNLTSSIRVPAPCHVIEPLITILLNLYLICFCVISFFKQYAHKLAYLVGQYIRAEPSETLSDQLYFL